MKRRLPLLVSSALVVSSGLARGRGHRNTPTFSTRAFGPGSYRVLVLDPAITLRDKHAKRVLDRYDNAVGYLDVDPRNDYGRPPWGYLSVANVWLAPELRGSGLGRQLYATALAEAHRQGYRGLASDVRDRNQRSDKLWAKARRDGNWSLLDTFTDSRWAT